MHGQMTAIYAEEMPSCREGEDNVPCAITHLPRSGKDEVFEMMPARDDIGTEASSRADSLVIPKFPRNRSVRIV